MRRSTLHGRRFQPVPPPGRFNMYASTSSPLPPHSTQPYPQWIVNRHRIKKLQIEAMAARARAGVLCAPNPASFIDLGPQIMADVARSPAQGTLTGPSALSPPPQSPTPSAISDPPTVVPLDTATSVAVPANSAPRGTTTTAMHQSGTPWGNSPITPPAASLLRSVPAWLWAAIGLAGLISVNVGRKGRR